MLDENEARKHIALLHDKARGLDGVLVLASFGEAPSGKLTPDVRNFAVGDVEGMTKAALELARINHRNVYAPLAVMRKGLQQGSKGGEDDVIASLGFVADFDNGTGLTYSSRVPFKPSYVVETSPNNRQCFFFFEKPLPLNTASDRVSFKNLAERLTSSCVDADSCGVDYSHVWRIPGLCNWPNNKKLKAGRDPNPFVVKAIEPFNGCTYLSSDIQKLPDVSASKIELSNSALEYSKVVDTAALYQLGEHSLVDLICKGAPDGERSEAVASVVWRLLDKGYGTGDIFRVIADNPAGIGERYNHSLTRIETDVLRLAAKRPSKESALTKEPIDNSFVLQELGEIDDSLITPRAFVLGTHLMRGKVSLLIAAGGVGKSTVSLAAGLSVATGQELLGLTVHEQGAVAFINNEDDTDEIKRRIAALQKYFSISSQELKNKVFFQTGDTNAFIIAKRTDKKTLIAHHKDALIDYLLEHNIKVLFVDPFLETHEADENDNRQISEVARMYREVAQKADCAVVLVHHTRKQQGQSSEGHAGNADSGRGASSLIGVARFVITLYDMSVKDATDLGIAEDDRHLYLRFDDAKANLSLRTHQPLWFRRESVTLKNGDRVGVVVVANNLTSAQAMKKATVSEILLARIRDHVAFSELRETGRMSREKFIGAMIKANAHLGPASQARGTLQGRTQAFLLGNGLSDDLTSVRMSKFQGMYLVSAFFNNAELPNNAGKSSA